MQVITVANEKGGVGKTTIASTIAAGLAYRGYAVLLLDGDAQGHVARAFGLAKEPGLYDLLVRGAAWKDVLRLVPPERYCNMGDPDDIRGKLFILPSNVETRNVANSISDGFALLKRLAQLYEVIDCVIIDTSPTPSLLHSTIIASTDAMLYCTVCEEWSIDGLAESVAHLAEFEALRAAKRLPGIRVIGMVPTMFDRRTIEHQQNLARLKSVFPEYVWEPISMGTMWAVATRARRPVFAAAPKSKAAREAWALIDRVEEVIAHEPA